VPTPLGGSCGEQEHEQGQHENDAPEPGVDDPEVEVADVRQGRRDPGLGRLVDAEHPGVGRGRGVPLGAQLFVVDGNDPVRHHSVNPRVGRRVIGDDIAHAK
jgi:hypothetical protein